MIKINWDRVRRDSIILVIVANFIFASVLIYKFNSLKGVVQRSAEENRTTNLHQKITNNNTAHANAYTFIVDRDILKNFTWDIDEIRNGTERYCNDNKPHWFSSKNCFIRIKPSILDAYKTTSPFGFQVHTVGETVYISYWKRITPAK